MDFIENNFFSYTKALLSHCLPVRIQHFHTMDEEFVKEQADKEFWKMLMKYVLPELSAKYHEMCKADSVCLVTTGLRTQYVVLCLEDAMHVSVGPFLETKMTDDGLYQVIRRLHLCLEDASKLRLYYQTVPVYDEDSIYEILCTMHQEYGRLQAGCVGNGDNKEECLRRIVLDLSVYSKEALDYDIQLEQMNRNAMYQMLESRYEQEDELLSFIENGNLEKAQNFWKNKSFASIDINRTKDTLRNMKNMILIANTLFRKAAHRGGVHPIYLDELSGKWGIQIENEVSIEALQSMPTKMIRSYCMLTKNQSLAGYSPIVRKALTFIHLNLSSPLSVGRIATEVGLSPDYLTRVCKKELGCSLTDYVNQRRIEAAIKLLNTTQLTVDEIGELVGFGSSSYFYAQFKKVVGVSPRKYRDGVLNR